MRIKGLPRPVKTVLLDYDGTIIDIRPKWWKPVEKAFQDSAGFVPQSQLQDNISDLMKQVPSKPSRFFMVKMMWSIGRKGGLSRLQTLDFIRRSRQNFRESKYLNIPIVGALEFIRTIRNIGIEVAIVTTATRSEIDNAISEIKELKDMITISREDVENLKPDPEPVRQALNRLNSSEEHAVMIGDFSSDVMAGKNAGTMTIGLSSFYPEISLPGLKEADPDLIVPFLKDLIPLIEEE